MRPLSLSARQRLALAPRPCSHASPAVPHSRRRGPAVALALCGATVVALLAVAHAPASGQTLTIPEYRELLLSKESVLQRLDRELTAANAQLDRLVTLRDEAAPRGPRRRELTGEIVRVSNRIAELERQRRNERADLRGLRSALQERYTTLIEANLQRLDGIQQKDPGYSDLLVETGRAISARDSLRLQIRIQESIPNFREFPIVATDGPAEIREKAGFYRDYVNDVDKRIAEIDAQIGEVSQLASVQSRMREFMEDLVFQGEDAPNRAGDAPGGGDIRDEPAIGAADDEGEPLGRSPEQRITELEEIRRQLVLLRRGFEIRVRDYEERARTVFSQQSTESREEIR